jgi:hypothetical protein
LITVTDDKGLTRQYPNDLVLVYLEGEDLKIQGKISLDSLAPVLMKLAAKKLFK